MQQRRLQARRHSTTYCYDFPAVFQDALLALWAAYEADSGHRQPPAPVVEATELVLDSANAPDFNPSDFRTANIGLKEVRLALHVLVITLDEGRMHACIHNV